MSEHEGILKGFKDFVEARKVFAKYKGKWFSGNHVGDIGECCALPPLNTLYIEVF